MEIKKLKKDEMNGLFIHVTPSEALDLASSLILQTSKHTPNSDRLEFQYIKGNSKLNYLTIAVDPECPLNCPHKGKEE